MDIAGFSRITVGPGSAPDPGYDGFLVYSQGIRLPCLSLPKLKAQSGLSDTGKGSVTQQQITDLNEQLMLARAEVTEKRAQLEQARQPSDSENGIRANLVTTTSPLIGQLRLQQSELIRREMQLRSKLGDRRAEVIAVAAQLAGINKAINDEAERILADLQSSWNIAVRREQSLEATCDG